MPIEIRTHQDRPIDPPGIRRLYDGEGWWPEPARDEPSIIRMLAGGPAVGAWRDDELVGFVRAVTDGVFRAYIEDMVVGSGVRGQGVGARLLERLHQELAEIDVISLFCHRDLDGFYEAAGYTFTGQHVAHRVRRS
ncbi:GNAT family N-acetyltransferase [Microlunatus speluncae]|uniref:GNAT family N-acetyltransferase n=1 Tax=Microlunatus speluncae TaxID=2594267 RepID=UPI00126608E4|nr:GNAT family N-acetyltransferase [Microlunatus speluncae]